MDVPDTRSTADSPRLRRVRIHLGTLANIVDNKDSIRAVDGRLPLARVLHFMVPGGDCNSTATLTEHLQRLFDINSSYPRT